MGKDDWVDTMHSIESPKAIKNIELKQRTITNSPDSTIEFDMDELKRFEQFKGTTNSEEQMLIQ